MSESCALGMIECGSLSRGGIVTDRMLKTARVELLMAQPVSGAKLLVVVRGGVAEVEAAVGAGLDEAGASLVDALFIPQLHPRVGEALGRTLSTMGGEALGLIETQTVAAGIRAADAAMKTAEVELLSLHLGGGIAGRALVHLTGRIADVEAAVAAGVEAVRLPQLLVDTAILARPHPDYLGYLVEGPGRAAPPPRAHRNPRDHS